jgi:hypothetical protein
MSNKKDPFRPAEKHTECPKCHNPFGWNKEDGLGGQGCGCGYTFTGKEKPWRDAAYWEKAISKFKEMTYQKGSFRVVWEYIGEGFEGDYVSEHSNDSPLLRFSCLWKYDEAKAQPYDDAPLDDSDPWVCVRDGSYCTRLPVDTSQKNLRAAAKRIWEVLGLPGQKRRLEELSWLCPEDFKKQVHAS